MPEELWLRWNLDPMLLAVLVLMTWFLRREPVGLIAVGVLVVAFVSPLCALSSALFSARVVHHVLLVAVAAPLLGSLRLLQHARGPGLALAVSATVLWAWHHPFAYDLALSNVAVYWLMQMSLLGSAVWFWSAIFGQDRKSVLHTVYIVVSFAQMGMLGALLTFSPSVLYAAHALTPYDWGMSPLLDQQLGGLIMWVPAGIPYGVALVVLVRQNWDGFRGNPA